MKTSPMRTLTVSLTPQQATRLQNAVDTGDYASNSEIVREALRLWERQEEVRALELDQLRRAYTEGMASGEGRKIDPTALLRELKNERRTRG